MTDYKKISLAKASVVLLAILAVGAGTAYAGSVVSKNSNIGQEAAENFAFVNAGVTRDDVTNLHSHLERNNGKYVYDIEFYVGNVEYEYEVLAKDGIILEKTIDDNAYNAAVSAKAQTDHSVTSDAEISVSVQDQTVPAQNPKESSQEEENVKSSDSKKNEAPAQAQTARSSVEYIGVERAKQIALEHAGLTESEVIFSKAKFDKEDDDSDEDPEYEIEFFREKMEYEYDIDALTGKIIEYSAEIDDD